MLGCDVSTHQQLDSEQSIRHVLYTEAERGTTGRCVDILSKILPGLVLWNAQMLEEAPSLRLAPSPRPPSPPTPTPLPTNQALQHRTVAGMCGGVLALGALRKLRFKTLALPLTCPHLIFF